MITIRGEKAILTNTGRMMIEDMIHDLNKNLHTTICPYWQKWLKLKDYIYMDECNICRSFFPLLEKGNCPCFSKHYCPGELVSFLNELIQQSEEK